MTEKDFTELSNRCEAVKITARGVREYVNELLWHLKDRIKNNEYRDDESLEKNLLRGAPNWQRYSEGAFSLVAGWDIRERLGDGYRDPIERQADALRTAYGIIRHQWMIMLGEED